MSTPRQYTNGPGPRFMQGPYGGYWKRPVAPGQKKRPPQRHFDAALSGDELAEFFLGLQVKLRSSWLQTAQWDEEWSRLYVTFKDGYKASIWCDAALAQRFADSASKGGNFWHDVVMNEGREVTPE